MAVIQYVCIPHSYVSYTLTCLLENDVKVKVLVTYASKYGATKGIADFIAERLRISGLEVDIFAVDDVINAGDYGAFVIGSALYMGRWLKEAIRFVSRNNSILSARPVWLFSSGPIGQERIDAKGRDLADPSVSGPVDLERIKSGLQVKDHRVFFGAFDPSHLGFFTRQIFKSQAVRSASPVGDFRDWNEIGEWAGEITQALRYEIHVEAVG